jgi:hypothetical protein
MKQQLICITHVQTMRVDSSNQRVEQLSCAGPVFGVPTVAAHHPLIIIIRRVVQLWRSQPNKRRPRCKATKMAVGCHHPPHQTLTKF